MLYAGSGNHLSGGVNRHSGGISGAEGLQKNLFVVLFGAFSLGFCIFHFMLLLYNAFSTGTPMPSRCSGVSGAGEACWCVLSCHAWGRNKTSTQVIGTPGCSIHGKLKGRKNWEPDAKSHFQLHNYWGENAFLNTKCGTEVSAEKSPMTQGKSLQTTLSITNEEPKPQTSKPVRYSCFSNHSWTNLK